jgi:hypothetical protein
MSKTKKKSDVPAPVSPVIEEGAAAPIEMVTTKDGAHLTVSRSTLEETLPKMLTFLRAVGTRPEVRAALEPLGFTSAEFKLGWSLLFACGGYNPDEAPSPVVDPVISQAIVALDNQDEALDTIVRVSLEGRAPTAAVALRKGLTTGRGASAVLYVRNLLARLDALDAGTLAKVTEADRKTACDTLRLRGLTPARRAELAQLVAGATKLTTLPATPEPATPEPATPDAPALDPTEAPLRAARAWYEEWSALALTQVKRRDHLIAMGLRKRKATSKPKST